MRTRTRPGAAAVIGALAAVLLSHPAAYAASPTGPARPTVREVAIPAVAATPAAAATRGTWRVVPAGPRSWRVSWTSPTRLPLTTDRPSIAGGGLTFSAPTLRADDRTVTSQVDATSAPDPARLHVLLSGDRLDVAGSDRAHDVARSAAPQRSDGGSADKADGVPVLADDPGTPGPFATVSSDYSLKPVKLPGMPEPIEMVGHVVEPTADAATGPRPLVLFMHGRHDVCYVPGHPHAQIGFDWPCAGRDREIPSQLGYVYIQQLLASQGYVTVSVRVNGINAQDFRLADGGAGARAAIIARHLDYWTTIAAAHRVDLQHVVLVGHSRGGEGVDRASLQIPLSAAYRIAGQVLIAPTDFADQSAAYVPTVTLLPYCDGDVSDLEGQRFTDSGRDLAADDTSLKSSVLVMGANHNFFNSEWTPGIAAAPAIDDWGGPRHGPCGKATPARLSSGEQRAVGATYVAGAVGLFAKDQQQYLPMYDGSRVTVPSIGGATVLSSAIGGGRVLREPGSSASLSLASGARTDLCTGAATSTDEVDDCGRSIGSLITPHWVGEGEQLPSRRFFEMTWNRAGQSGGLSWSAPLDISAGTLDLRTIVDPRRGDAGLEVRLTDATGASATLTPVGGTTLPALLPGAGVAKLWAQTLRVDPAQDPAQTAGLDLTRITGVDLIATSTRGRVWVADVAAAPSALAPVPDTRLPVVDLGPLRITEGDSGRRTARVPFTVSGDLTRPARLIVTTVGQERGSLDRFTIDLAAGQRSGSVPVAYDGNRLDDRSPLRTEITAYAAKGVLTGDYLSELQVIDDDPTPALAVTTVHKTVSEGQSATFRLRLAAPVDYDDYVSGSVVGGPTPALHGSDVPAAWLARHAGVDLSQVDPATSTLKALRVSVYGEIRAGSRTLVLTIPIAKDGLAEARESVTVKFRIGHLRVTRTVFVARSR